MSTSSTSSSNQLRLKRNLSVWDAVVMSAAFMGPAVSMYFNTGYAAGFAGAAMPLSFVISMIIALILAKTVGEFSKIAPSAGAFYVFANKGIGPRSGFLSGWLMFIGYSLLEPAEEALFGITASEIIKSQLGIDIPWYIISLIAWAVVFTLSTIGAKQSMKITMLLFLAEVGVLLVLCFLIIGKGGYDGLHFSVFNPSNSPTGFSGVALGMVYGMLSFVGFESATTLAEEVVHPKRNVYYALMGSTILVGGIYIVATFAEVNGFGLGNMDALAKDVSPFVTLATQYGSPVLVLLIALAGLSSILAVTINTNNAIARVIYVMGRETVLPSFFGKVHQKFHTPSNAVMFQSLMSLVLLLLMGFSVGPSLTYGYLGAILTLGIIPVYIMASIGYVLYQKKQGNIRKHPFKNFILPIIASLLMLIPLSASFYPVPPFPYNILPLVVIIYAIVGFIVAKRLERDPERFKRAGEILGDADQGINV
ncbi:APC family permease [Ferviditalea candida]|uniref:APC family permease n=1 Tax=Ferviditalea candida TaxID=3108399 RepID=A0ABU5ZCB2_9BACL|nr:APC family permease [Paenibacillaceae bacterium T2]